MNLTDAQHDKWMVGLRSGLYPQTNNELASKPRIGVDPEDPLRAGVGYCCMGVCGKVAFRIPLMKMVARSYLADLGGQGFFPNGLPFTEPEQVMLGSLNDRCKLTFPQIAAFVEAGGLDLCKPAFIYEIDDNSDQEQ